jgi:hypothetical protein
MEQPTGISIKLETTVNLGNYENIRLEIRVDDRVREGIDKNTGEAIDRIYSLVETKLAEKLETYEEKNGG